MALFAPFYRGDTHCVFPLLSHEKISRIYQRRRAGDVARGGRIGIDRDGVTNMSLTLLRHAPPPIAYHGRYIGHSDIPIDPALFTPIILPQTYDVIYSSDLSRCTQTLEYLGYRDFHTDERLREVCFKEHFEGKSFEEISRMECYDQSFLESESQWHEFVCAEPIETFRGRIREFLSGLSYEQNILICSHAGTIHEILRCIEETFIPLNYLEYTIVRVK